MSYDVSEHSAQDSSNGWYPPEPPAGPRHRYGTERPPGYVTGGYPAYQPGTTEPAGVVPAPAHQSFPPRSPLQAPRQPPPLRESSAQPATQQPATQEPPAQQQPPAASYGSGAYPAYGGDPRQEPVGGGYPAGGYAPYQGGTPTGAGQPGYGWTANTEQYRTPPVAEPVPEPTPAEMVPRQHDPAAADLRSQVVRRIRFMNFRHAEHAWERRYRDPLGPHALAFLYSEPARGKPPRYTLRTATRLFLAGPEVDDLPTLLRELAEVVSRQPAGSYDPRVLADRTEEMSAGSFYVGVAVSSLDTPAGTWAQVRQRVVGSIDVPGRCYAILTDDTMVQMDRGGESQFGHFEVRCTDSLDEIPGDSMQRWTYDRSLRDMADPDTADVWRGLLDLHNTIVGKGADEY